MATEIERKFLVQGEFRTLAERSARIIQGYLSSAPERSVRVRILNDKGFITIKSATDKSGLSRYEWEKEIPLAEAVELLELCEPGVIDKTRYYIRQGKHTFEVDEFHGENEGLFLAEIEIDNAGETFDRPEWLGTEVTGDARYYNSSLKKFPFSRW